jgi:hypothetical protein
MQGLVMMRYFSRLQYERFFHKASNSNQLRATDFAIINNITENIKLKEFLFGGGGHV